MLFNNYAVHNVRVSELEGFFPLPLQIRALSLSLSLQPAPICMEMRQPMMMTIIVCTRARAFCKDSPFLSCVQASPGFYPLMHEAAGDRMIFICGQKKSDFG